MATSRSLPSPSVAYHEAGHGCVGLAYGVPVRHLTIEPDAESAGRVMPVRAAWKGNPTALALMLLAGGEAEKQYTGRETAGDGHDLKKINLLLKGYHDDPDSYLQMYRALTAAAVVRHWPWIERTARVLLRKRRISGGECWHLR